MNRSGRFLSHWAPVIGWMALIFVLSSLPNGAVPDYGAWDLPVKKGAHLTAYAVLSVLLLRAWSGEGAPSRRAVWLALVCSVLYAISDEYHQSFVAGRGSSPVDVGIDALGACAALAARLKVKGVARRFRPEL
ncbi:MAG: VanZ family protein [Chloroflexi bacterium]|nr:VanZ family protein [Chloroflexota bacterium]